MAAKPQSPSPPLPKVELPVEDGATDAFPADDDVSIPPPGSDQTVGAFDPEKERKGRPGKPE